LSDVWGDAAAEVVRSYQIHEKRTTAADSRRPAKMTPSSSSNPISSTPVFDILILISLRPRLYYRLLDCDLVMHGGRSRSGPKTSSNSPKGRDNRRTGREFVNTLHFTDSHSSRSLSFVSRKTVMTTVKSTVKCAVKSTAN
jgi:hypothetical protein